MKIENFQDSEHCWYWISYSERFLFLIWFVSIECNWMSPVVETIENPSLFQLSGDIEVSRSLSLNTSFTTIITCILISSCLWARWESQARMPLKPQPPITWEYSEWLFWFWWTIPFYVFILDERVAAVKDEVYSLTTHYLSENWIE